jgi:hypothetical protein
MLGNFGSLHVHILYMNVLLETPPNMGMKQGSLNIKHNKAEKFEIV